jgi:hypothetical protein
MHGREDNIKMEIFDVRYEDVDLIHLAQYEDQ